MRSRIKGRDGSGSFVWPDAQTSWLGHPAHAADFPADSDSVPFLDELASDLSKERYLLGNAPGHLMEQKGDLELV